MRNLVDRYCGEADCILLCYSITSKESFKNLNEWLEKIDIDESRPKIPLAILGTKSDLDHDRKVRENEGYNLLRQIGDDRVLLFRETTTYGENVTPIQDLFQTIARDVLQKKGIR